MAEPQTKACPYMSRCAHGAEDCTEERSKSCEVINKTEPPQPKKYDPQELVSIPLSWEQWQTVIGSLQNDAGRANANMVWWRDFCDDKRMGAETAAKYERWYRQSTELAERIQETLCIPRAECEISETVENCEDCGFCAVNETETTE